MQLLRAVVRRSSCVNMLLLPTDTKAPMVSTPIHSTAAQTTISPYFSSHNINTHLTSTIS
jgi:hypothetical protein